MDNRPAHRTLLGKSFDFRHQIVADFAFNRFGAGNVDLVLVGAQIGDLFSGDQASFLLRLGQGDPKAAQQPAFFDFPRQHLPKCFHYTGPWQEPTGARLADFPWDRLDGRPLIYASLGTLQNRLERPYQIIAEACAGLDAQLVVALGRSGTAPEKLAGDPIVAGYAPQRPLLQRSRMVITHGGLNTTLEALTEGLPMVA